MKHLYSLTVLLLAFAAQAQKITQKDLAGTWRFKIMQTDGLYVDFETDSVYVEQRDDLPPDAKSFYPILKAQYTGNYFRFEPQQGKDLTMEIKFGESDPQKKSMQLLEKDGRQYLSDGNEQREVVIKDGLLHIYPPTGADNPNDDIYLVLRKE